MYCNWKYAWLWLIAFLSCEKKEDPAATDLPYYGQADFTPLWLEPHDEQLQEFHHVHPFRLYDQEGSIITEQDLDGKITVANFFFSICPSVCPKMTDNLLDVQEALLEDRQTLLLSHTVMPWVDSVARLKQFALERGQLTSLASAHRPQGRTLPSGPGVLFCR
ncbi:MAG: hypothetical protein HC842_01665 [Cytophagales bacterium]|nr:hypothetical protein [Cytophagales bacterium]